MNELGSAPPDLAETHISIVFFTPTRAYKLLKPVRTGFLDHSDRQRRLDALDREYELNRRLAPDVYLGTADLVEDGTLVDRLLIMKRLPHDRRLSALVGTPELDPALRSVARTIATFHAGLEPVFSAEGMATAAGLGALWESSCAEIEPSVGDVIDPDEFEMVRHLARRYLGNQVALFDRRRSDGMIRDGHGDLTAEDIFVLDDGPRVLDCLAFDDSLRVSDVLADIGFLVMDVHRLEGSGAAQRLMGWYSEFSGEHHPSSLAHHYVAYRAHVRAKVEVIRHRQGVETAAPAARSYHQLARHHLERAKLRLVLVGGGPGSGKTTLAHAIADRTRWLVLDTDVVRKDLRRVPHRQRRDDAPWEGIYDEKTTEITYRTLLDRAAVALTAGETILLDASWISDQHRAEAWAIADGHGADLVELECRVDPALAKRRIADRRVLGEDASDARAEIVDEMAAHRDPWPSAIGIDTSVSIEESVRRALDHILDASNVADGSGAEL